MLCHMSRIFDNSSISWNRRSFWSVQSRNFGFKPQAEAGGCGHHELAGLDAVGAVVDAQGRARYPLDGSGRCPARRPTGRRSTDAASTSIYGARSQDPGRRQFWHEEAPASEPDDAQVQEQDVDQALGRQIE